MHLYYSSTTSHIIKDKQEKESEEKEVREREYRMRKEKKEGRDCSRGAVSCSSLTSQFSSVQFSHSVVSNSLRPHESQHARLPCPSPTPGVYSNPCPSSRWCHPAISSSVIPFSNFILKIKILKKTWFFLKYFLYFKWMETNAWKIVLEEKIPSNFSQLICFHIVLWEKQNIKKN